MWTALVARSIGRRGDHRFPVWLDGRWSLGVGAEGHVLGALASRSVWSGIGHDGARILGTGHGSQPASTNRANLAAAVSRALHHPRSPKGAKAAWRREPFHAPDPRLVTGTAGLPAVLAVPAIPEVGRPSRPEGRSIPSRACRYVFMEMRTGSEHRLDRGAGG